LRIGITSRIMSASGYSEDRDALAHDWGSFLSKALPQVPWMALPNLGPEQIVPYCQSWAIDRLILSGGDDIGATPLRDGTETGLLSWAEQRRIPVLGVCRGMQLMAHLAGTRLVPVEGHVATRHGLHGMRDDNVNSFHTLGLAECPAGYEILARAEDGGIEAMRHLVLPWEAWMWHPERDAQPNPRDLEAIKRIFR